MSLPTSCALFASAMKRSMPPHSSPSKWSSTTYASFAGSSTSPTAFRMFSYSPWTPVWISVGISSSIKNWLNVIGAPIVPGGVEIL